MLKRLCVSVQRICSEFENIRKKASKVPENTDDIAEMLDFVHVAKSKGLAHLNEEIRVNNPVSATSCL